MPDDVRFATTKNCGNGPAMSIPLTCVEFNPFAAGEAVAQAAVNFLEGSEEKYDVASVSRYVIVIHFRKSILFQNERMSHDKKKIR